MFVNRLRWRGLAALFAAFVTAVPVLLAAPAQAETSSRVVVTFTSARAANRVEGEHIAPTVVSLQADSTSIGALEQSPDVVAVEPDVTFRATDLDTSPTDPCFVGPDSCSGLDAWQFGDLDISPLWARTHGASATIAIVDGGVDATVPDIADKLVAPEIDLSSAHDGPSDHGTAVASLAAGAVDNGVASGGIGWESRLLSIKVLDRAGVGKLSAVAAGVVQATDLGAQVINLSLSGQFTTALSTAVQYAIDHGVVVVAAAGNDGTDTPKVTLPTGTVDGGYPARYPGVVAVGAVGRDHAIASFSDFGSWVDVFAPGVDLPAPVVGGQLEAFSGTSAAAPLVAGIAALVASSAPGTTSAAMKSLLHDRGLAIPASAGAVRVDPAALAGDDALFPDAPNSPVGTVDGVGVAPGGSVLTGWTVDPNAHDSLDIHTYVDGRFATSNRADAPRPDVAAVKPGYGPNHGFMVQLSLPPGQHVACVYGINVGAGVNALIECVPLAVQVAPFGAIDGVERSGRTLTLTGWVIDPATQLPAFAQAVIDGVSAPAEPAGLDRPDVAAVYPAFGEGHGYRLVMTIPSGRHLVCVAGVGASLSASVGLGCRTI